MIISHKYKLIFIKTRKTAGTSIEVFLSGRCGPDDVVTPIDPPVAPHQARNHEAGGFFNHIDAAGVRARVAREVWDGYEKFCVERNPWDKTLSYYHMEKARRGGVLSLDEYLETGELPVNYPLYTEPGDPSRVIVDRVLRYERLTEDLAEVFGRLGIPFDRDLGIRAKGEYRTDRRPYREVFAPEQAARVAAAHAPEIALHGYAF